MCIDRQKQTYSLLKAFAESDKPLGFGELIPRMKQIAQNQFQDDKVPFWPVPLRDLYRQVIFEDGLKLASKNKYALSDEGHTVLRRLEKGINQNEPV